MGFLTALAIGSILASGAYAVSQSKKGNDVDINLPEAPTTEDALTKAKTLDVNKRRAMARQDTIRTSPLGVNEQATIAKKKLLGQ